MPAVPPQLATPPDETVLFPRHTARSAQMLLQPDATADELRYAGECRGLIGETGDIGFIGLRDALIRGSGYIFQGEAVITHPGAMVPYVASMIASGHRVDIGHHENHPVRTIDETALVIVAEAQGVYGHWLLDCLPRLWLANKHLDAARKPYKLLMPYYAPRWAFDLVGDVFGYDHDAIVTYDYGREELLCRRLIAPTMLHRGHVFFHDRMNDYVRDLIAFATLRHAPNHVPHDRLFISRRHHRGETTSARRGLANESDVLEAAEAAGYRVVCPETLSWPEQIRLFSQARVIVGEAGSALHNTLFAPAGAVVGTIPPANHVQAGLAALRGHGLASLSPGSSRHEADQILHEVDIARLSRFLAWLPTQAEP